ncbi:MAG: cytochrome c biogenesis protein CcsA [Oligoflexales bacterium]
MNGAETEKSKFELVGKGLLILVLASWAWAIFMAPSEQNMGEIYRIIYLHVPSAFSAFFCAFVLFLISVYALMKKDEALLLPMQASSELGLLFTVLTLVTGSLWGYPTWGTFWTWDARLTTTLLLAILLAGYLLVHRSFSDPRRQLKVCASLGILIFADVPIIYKSVTWWRTLHQPQTILRAGGSTMDPEMLRVLLINLVLLLAFGLFLIIKRTKNLRLAKKIEAFTLSDLHM